MRWIEPELPPLSRTRYGLHPLVEQTLARRGLTTPQAVHAFLEPDSYAPTPASALPGMQAAVGRICAAIRAGESLCVWGDFDVDGQTSTALLVEALRALGAKVGYHIPVRARESHGVHLEALKEIIEAGAGLVVTCDTGVSAGEAVDYARSHGVDMVISDHHDLPPELPQAVAIVNPKMLPEDHPLGTLSGVGVAYKLVEALKEALPANDFDTTSLLDLVALGLIADLAILRGDARYLVQKGLLVLRKTQRLGLQIMMELAELKPETLNESHIGFSLGPRLNALGRLGDANPAVELLTTSDAGRARPLATQLENYNAERQLLCNQVTQAAEAQLKADPALLTQPLLILAQASWPGGIIGIVASRLVERYHKAAILFSTPQGEPARGSARSVEGLHITAAIAAQKDLLLSFGGHPMAAGLALPQENLPEFRRRIARTVERMLGEIAHTEAALEVDGWLPLSEANLELAEQLEALAPYGPGNEKLILAAHDLTLQAATPIGRNREHVRLSVAGATGETSQVLWWNGGGEEMPEGRFDLAFTLRASDYRGVRQAELEFVGFRPVAEKATEIRKGNMEVVDLRTVDDPREQLLPFQGQASTVIWAEAEHKRSVGGLGRHELTPAETLVIWTCPPAPHVMQAALETVRPGRVVLFAVELPGGEEPQAFLERLAGLAKFVISQRAGQTTLVDLAAASAQGETAVKLGLEWLSKRGKLRVQPEAGSLLLSAGKAEGDESASAQLLSQIQDSLKETAAYRRHFRQADPTSLL